MIMWHEVWDLNNAQKGSHVPRRFMGNEKLQYDSWTVTLSSFDVRHEIGTCCRRYLLCLSERLRRCR